VRGRDLKPVPARAPVVAVGRFGAGRGLGLPFGLADAAMLAGLAAAAAAARFRPAPVRALMVLEAEDAGLVAAARRLGFVVEADDPRLGVVACSGAPACGAALLPTRRLAAAVAAAGLVEPGWRLHLSGCAKRCAQPAGPAVTLVGQPDGWALTGEGMAVPAGLAERLRPVVAEAVA
jgi:precorrin-3B synthase